MAEAGERGGVVATSRDVLSRHARSFRWGAVFLPPEQRDDAAVIYAFCRLVDDLADETPDPELAASDLQQLKEELEGKIPARPLVATFLAVVRRLDIDVSAARELIAGARSDLGASVRMADDASLLRYCYRVAGTVGLMMCGVLRVREDIARPYAVDLGIAMQLTNICRDVLEDARRQRIYLPETRLRAEGVSSTSLEHVTGAERRGVQAVVLELLELADRYYDSADEGMRFIPLRSRAAILVAARLYRAIGLRLRARAGDALAGRTIVPWHRKVYRTCTALGSLLLPRLLGLTRLRAHEAALHRSLAGLPGTNPALTDRRSG